MRQSDNTGDSSPKEEQKKSSPQPHKSIGLPSQTESSICEKIIIGGSFCQMQKHGRTYLL